jgi:hypothetical protein
MSQGILCQICLQKQVPVLVGLTFPSPGNLCGCPKAILGSSGPKALQKKLQMPKIAGFDSS